MHDLGSRPPSSRPPIRKLASLLALGSLVALLAGCGARSLVPTAQAPGPSPSVAGPGPRGIAGPYPRATKAAPLRGLTATLEDIGSTPISGFIGDRPFLVECALFWDDPQEAYIAFTPGIPLTEGRFDPRARRAPEPAFLIWLDPEKVKPGRWQVAWGDRNPPPDCPVRRACVQVPTGEASAKGDPSRSRVACLDSRWTLALRIDSVVKRQSTDKGVVGTSVAGGLAVLFDPHQAWLYGSFVARDVLRDAEVAPGQPSVPAPVVGERH